MELNGLCADADTIHFAELLIKELQDGTFPKDTTPNSGDEFSGELEHHDYLECLKFTGTRFFESIINVHNYDSIAILLP